MRKYLAATVLGAMLMAGQAAATDSGVVNLGDRIGSPSAAADSMEGNNQALWFALGVILVIAIVSAAAAGTNSGAPTSP